MADITGYKIEPFMNLQFFVGFMIGFVFALLIVFLIMELIDFKMKLSK